MKPWTNPLTVACLWLIAAVLALGWIAGLVALSANEDDWAHTRPARHAPPVWRR